MHNQLPNNTPAGWLARIIGAVISIVVLAGLFFVGLTVFAAAAGLALLVFVVFGVRVWWLRRRLRRQGGAAPSMDRSAGGVTLDGEFEERRPRD